MNNHNNNEEFFSEFWIGKDIDPTKYWEAYHAGEGYKQKFFSMHCHVFEITFVQNEKNVPLFNMEPVYKTLKGYYHELKKDLLPESEYNSSGPLFIYEINRGSGIWTFLGELYYLLIMGTTLSEEKIKGQRLDNLEKKLRILKEYFGDGNINEDLFQRFMKASTPHEMEEALQNLFNEKISGIRVSRHPVTTGVEEAKKEMIDLRDIVKLIDLGE